MTKTYATPQPMTGSETVCIHQVQNGQIVKCTTPISSLPSAANLTTFFASLPTSLPATAGVVWNNNGVISIS